MIKAFVFGKFLPFHKGHEAMIRFAMEHADLLTVLICCSDKENISHHIREKWIRETFHEEEKLRIETFQYLESELPNTSVSSREVSEVWARAFKKLYPGHSLLVTSEPYGEFVAGYMNIRHLCFDQERKLFPVASTFIRRNASEYWNFLPASVKPYFIRKIIILGTESTGKTTLTEKLSAHFKASKVLEAARDIIADSKKFCFEDLHHVAEEHAKKIVQAAGGDCPLVIIDTDVHTTVSYADFVFQKELQVNASVYDQNRADLYLYLKNDVPYIQDGTRLEKKERDLLDLSHRAVLKRYNVPVIEIGGSWEQRLEEAIRIIEDFLHTKF